MTSPELLMSATRLLNESDLVALAASLPTWTVHQDGLRRDWTFADFTQAILFVNRVAAVAERANHHPDIDIRFNRVYVLLVSHDANGVTERDAAMAREFESIAV